MPRDGVRLPKSHRRADSVRGKRTRLARLASGLRLGRGLGNGRGLRLGRARLRLRLRLQLRLRRRLDSLDLVRPGAQLVLALERPRDLLQHDLRAPHVVPRAEGAGAYAHAREALGVTLHADHEALVLEVALGGPEHTLGWLDPEASQALERAHPDLLELVREV